MKAVITSRYNGTRFFLTDEGLASDIPERARTFYYSHDAQHVANIENADAWRWCGIRWNVAHMLHNGALAENKRLNESAGLLL
jgi:hypothetical protein